MWQWLLSSSCIVHWVFGRIKSSKVYFCGGWERAEATKWLTFKATEWLTLNDGLRAACSRTMALENNLFLN